MVCHCLSNPNSASGDALLVISKLLQAARDLASAHNRFYSRIESVCVGLCLYTAYKASHPTNVTIWCLRSDMQRDKIGVIFLLTLYPYNEWMQLQLGGFPSNFCVDSHLFLGISWAVAKLILDWNFLLMGLIEKYWSANVIHLYEVLLLLLALTFLFFKIRDCNLCTALLSWVHKESATMCGLASHVNYTRQDRLITPSLNGMNLQAAFLLTTQ